MLDARTHNYLAAWAEVPGRGRAGLDGYLHRRSERDALPRRAARPGALSPLGARGSGARGHGCHPAGRPGRGGRRRDAAGAGKLRFRLLRKAFGATVRGGIARRVREFWPGGDFRARRALRLSRAYAERVPAASAPAAPGQWLAADADRHGHAAQPRTDAQPGGRRPAGEPAGRSRPDGDGRRRASAGTARVRPRDRCRGDRPAA